MSGNPYIVGALLVAGMVGWMLLLREYQRRFAPDSEMLRKLLHVPGGLLAVSLPFIFSEPQPAIFALGALLLVLVAARRTQILRRGIGAVVGSVARRSHGELWFPISVAILFLLARNNFLLYSLPLLILTFADAAAALVGKRYGQIRCSVSRGTKSMEGSMAFFVVAFLIAGVLLALHSAETDAKPVLTAAILALSLCMAEAACANGLDNLVLPVGGFFLLRWLLILSTEQLAWTLAATIAFVTAALISFVRERIALCAAEASPNAK